MRRQEKEKKKKGFARKRGQRGKGGGGERGRVLIVYLIETRGAWLYDGGEGKDIRGEEFANCLKKKKGGRKGIDGGGALGCVGNVKKC